MRRTGYFLLGALLALSGGAAALQGVDLSDSNTGITGRSDLLAHGRGNGGYASGRYYMGEMVNLSGSLSGTTLVVAANTLYVMPFSVSTKVTWTKIGINVQSAAGTNCRLGIYNFANGVPTTKVVDAGLVSSAGTGLQEATISQVTEVGIYGLIVLCDNTPTLTASTINTGVGGGAVGATNIGTLDTQMLATFTFGALPASFSAGGVGAITYTTVANPILWLRK